MCAAMPHSALAGMSSDPKTGVVVVHRSAHIVMEKEDISDLKEALIRKLNRNMNKFYPDAGGILLGYQSIKMKKSTSEVTPTPVHIRAEFFLFRPQVGSDLMCVVSKKEEGRITCLAHRVFQVEVYSPPQCWERVFVGQMVVVKVEAVEQMAWEEPRIVATLPELTGDNVTPFIDIVENLDDDECESLTDSGISISTAGMSRGDRSTDILMEEETSKASSDSQSPQANVKTVQDDGKKRKAEVASSAPAIEEASPANKRSKKDSKSSPAASQTASKANKRTRSVSKSSSVDSETSLTSHSSNSDPNTENQFTVSSHQHPSVIPPLSLVKSMPPPPPASSPKSKSSPVKKTPSKMLTMILPKSPPAQSKSADSDHNSSPDDEDADVEKTPESSKPTVDGITKTIQDLPTDSVVAKLQAFQPLDPTVMPGKLPELIVAPKTPKPDAIPGVGCPPGFQSVGKKRVKLTGPDGGVFDSYKKAWKWVDENPNYLVKSGLESAIPSLASPSASGNSLTDMFSSQPESVEIPQVVDGGGASGKAPEVPQANTKQPKLPKKFVPTPIVKARQKVEEANHLKLLVDPSYSKPEAEPHQSQNLLVQESDTEYQSQSLLLPTSKDAKKTGDQAGINTTKAGVTKSPKMVDAATSPLTSVTKSPGKQGSDRDDESGAGSSFESSKQIKAAPQSKIVPEQSPNTNVDASRTSSNSSSEDSSSDEEPPPPPQNRSVVENVPVKQKIATTSDADTTSYESATTSYESATSNDTVTVPGAATRPSETVDKKAVSSSSESGSDSSEECDVVVNKSDHTVTVIVTDPVVSAAAASTESTEDRKNVQETTKQVAKPVKLQIQQPSSSSSDSDSGDKLSQSPAKRKLTKKKNSPKPIAPKTTLNPSSADKSPHLSSTVMSGTDRLKDKIMVPDGISPIIKTRHKTKTLGKPNGMAYFDQVMATSSMGSRKSDGKPAESDSSASDKNVNKKKNKKKVAGFL